MSVTRISQKMKKIIKKCIECKKNVGAREKMLYYNHIKVF